MKINLLFFIFLLLPAFLKADTISLPKLDTIKPFIYDLTNKSPLPTLKAGEKVMAGDFEVEILEARGGGGNFSGKGFMRVPYFKLAKLNVVFNNIKVNTDRRLIDGYFQAVVDWEDGSIVNTTELVKAVSEIVNVLKASILEIANKIKSGNYTEKDINQQIEKNIEASKKIEEEAKKPNLTEAQKDGIKKEQERLEKINKQLEQTKKDSGDCNKMANLIINEIWEENDKINYPKSIQNEIMWASTERELIMQASIAMENKSKPQCASNLERLINEKGGGDFDKPTTTNEISGNKFLEMIKNCYETGKELPILDLLFGKNILHLQYTSKMKIKSNTPTK